MVSFFSSVAKFDEGNWTTGGTSSSWAWGQPHKTTITAAHSGQNVWVNGNLNGQYNNK